MTTLSRLRDRDVCKRALFLGAAEARAIPRAGLDQVSVTSGPAAAISSGIHALEEARVTTENSALEQVPYRSPILTIREITCKNRSMHVTSCIIMDKAVIDGENMQTRAFAHLELFPFERRERIMEALKASA